MTVSIKCLAEYIALHQLYILRSSDTYIQKAKKVFTDSRSRRNLNTLNTQLQDVQRIMVQNIDDVLQRGTVLSGMELFCLPKEPETQIIDIHMY